MSKAHGSHTQEDNRMVKYVAGKQVWSSQQREKQTTRRENNAVQELRRLGIRIQCSHNVKIYTGTLISQACVAAMK